MKYEKLATTKQEEPTVFLAKRDTNIKPGETYGPVIRDLYIVECCTRGKGGVSVNERYFPVNPGDCYVLLPGDRVTHFADEKEPREGVFCAIDGLQVGRAFKRAGIDSEHPFVPADRFDGVLKEIEKMIELSEEKNAGTGYAKTACIYSLLAGLLAKTPEDDTKRRVERALALIETSYYLPLSVEEIAAECGFERSYFSVIFKAETGVSPHAYLNTVRIQKAVSLLKSENSPLTAVAESVGLDPVAFYRIFREQTGKTPDAFRRACRESKNQKT